MSTPRPVRRRYDSPRRRAQADATRAAVLASARSAFLDRGYAATTIRSIADAAGVSPETVFATFGDKGSLLAAVVDASIVGDDAPVPLLERGWVHELRAEPDRFRRAAALARNGARILERRSGIDEVVREASWTDPALAALAARLKADRVAGQRALLEIVAGGEGFRSGLDLDSATDVLFALGSPEVWRLLVRDRGWSPDRFEVWYAEVVTSLLA